MKDQNKNVSNISVDEELYGEFLDINEINEEYIKEFGSEQATDDVDVKVKTSNEEITENSAHVAKNTAPVQQPYYVNSVNGTMYNEISRLREELAKTQNAQMIQAELNRLREEFNTSNKAPHSSHRDDEIIRLKAQIRAMRGVDDEYNDFPQRRNDCDMGKLLSDISAVISESEQKIITAINNVINNSESSETAVDSDVCKALNELRNDITNATINVASGDTDQALSTPSEVNLFLSEIVSLRDELQEYKDEVSELIAKVSGVVPTKAVEENESPVEKNDDVAMMIDELTIIHSEISNYTDELENLKAGIVDIKNIVRAGIISDGNTGTANLETAVVLNELNEIKDKVQAITSVDEPNSVNNEQLEEILKSVNELPSKIGSGITDEDIAKIESKLNSIATQMSTKQAVASPAPSVHSMTNIQESLNTIIDEVRLSREEPDYGVMQEVLILREEFRAFISKMNEKSEVSNVGVEAHRAFMDEVNAIKAEVLDIKETLSNPLEIQSDYDHNKDKEEIFEEIKTLKEQLFAIELVKVDNGTGNVSYENYNDVLLSEVENLKQELDEQKKANAEMMNIIKNIASKLEI